MKKLGLCLCFLLIFALLAPVATAAPPSNAEKNLGNLLCAPFRIVAAPVIAVGKLVQGKPAAVLTLPRDIRRETFDGVESLVRIPFAAPIEKESGEMGAANTGIADASLDWLVDGALYGVAAGVINWNEASGVHHVLLNQSYTLGAATAVGVGLLDIGGAAVEAAEAGE